MPQNILGFVLEWFDPVSTLVHEIYMKYYLDDDTIELLQNAKNSTFLARIYYPDVDLKDLYVGNSITIFNRLLVVKGYCNTATSLFMEKREVHILCSLDAQSIQEVCNVMEIAMKYNFKTNRVKKTAKNIYEDSIQLNSGDVVIEFVATSPTDVTSFISEAKSCISQGTINLDQCTVTIATKLFEQIICEKSKNTCTLCIIKPHILKSKKEGLVLKDITAAGFCIDSLVSLHMNMNMAEYLFEVYRGVFPRYTSIMEQMVSGPILAIQLSYPDDPSRVVPLFRDLCGPLEPALGQKILPNTLRAKYGTDIVTNTVHCTDLPEDGATEVTYIFETLSNI